MAWTNLFTIGTTDLTQYEDKEMHAVNRTDVYTSWTDGNWNDHRVIARTRGNGTGVLNFRSDADYTAFMTDERKERERLLPYLGMVLQHEHHRKPQRVPGRHRRHQVGRHSAHSAPQRDRRDHGEVSVC